MIGEIDNQCLLHWTSGYHWLMIRTVITRWCGVLHVWLGNNKHWWDYVYTVEQTACWPSQSGDWWGQQQMQLLASTVSDLPGQAWPSAAAQRHGSFCLHWLSTCLILTSCFLTHGCTTYLPEQFCSLGSSIYPVKQSHVKEPFEFIQFPFGAHGFVSLHTSLSVVTCRYV